MERWNVNFHSLNEPYNDGLSIMSDFSELHKVGHCDYYQILCRRLDIRATSVLDPETFFTNISSSLIQVSIEDHSVNSMLQDFLESTGIEIDFPGHIINADDRTTTVTRALVTAFEYIMHSVNSDLDILNRQSSGSSGMIESPASASERSFHSLHNTGVYADTGRKFISPFGDEVPKQRGSLANNYNHSSRLRGFEDFLSIPKRYDNLSTDDTILNLNIEGRSFNEQVCETFAPPYLGDPDHQLPFYASSRFPTQALLGNFFGEAGQDHIRFSLPTGSSSSVLGNQFSNAQSSATQYNANNNLVGRLPVGEFVKSDAVNNTANSLATSNTVTTAATTSASRVNPYEIISDVHNHENSNRNLSGRTRSRSSNNNNSMIRRKRIKLVNHPEYLDGQILWPKGVYNTEQGAYRVQLNLPNSNQKFSRNVKLFDDAVWLYEIAILIADSPMELNVMIDSGNFAAMQSLELLKTRGDYYRLLGDHVLKNLDGKYLRSPEKATAILAYDKLKSESGVNLLDQKLSILTRTAISNTSSSSSSSSSSSNNNNIHTVLDLSPQYPSNIHPSLFPPLPLPPLPPPPQMVTTTTTTATATIASTTAVTDNVFCSVPLLSIAPPTTTSISQQFTQFLSLTSSSSSSSNSLFTSNFDSETRFPNSTANTMTAFQSSYDYPQAINICSNFNSVSRDGKSCNNKNSNKNSNSIIAQPSLDDYTQHRHLLMLSETTCNLVDHEQATMHRQQLQNRNLQQQQHHLPLLWSPDYLEPI